MIAAAAYYAYKEHQKKLREQQEQDEQQDPVVGTTTTDAATAAAYATTSPHSSWFESLPLEDSAWKCYFATNDPRQPSQEMTPPNSMESNSTSRPNETSVVAFALESTAFNDDVRKQWIQAVFGAEFPNKSEKDTAISSRSISAEHNSSIVSAWQGVGLSQIPSYTTYTVEVPPPSLDSSASRQSGSPDERSNIAAAPPSRLGVTLSRLSLGLYVRHVHPGSEAWCAGVQPNSILVSINHGTINLLAEPTKIALERIWQYEGLDAVSPSNDCSNNKSSSSGSVSSLKIQEPISMTFMLDGTKYDVVFFTNPPYGIEWAPCGNFCLVHKVTTERAKQAGILPSFILAGVFIDHDDSSSNGVKSGRSLQELDHQVGAEMLKQAAQSKGKTRIQLCSPPTAARSGYWERQQDVSFETTNMGSSNLPNKSGSSNSLNGRNDLASKLQRPDVALDMDGVQVRVHPWLSGRGILQNQVPAYLADLSNFATRVASGESISPYPAARNIFRTIAPGSSGNAGTTEGNRRIRACPQMERKLVHCWGIHQAMSYICFFHAAEYDEHGFLGSSVKNGCPPSNFFESIDEEEIQKDVLKTFLLFWVALMSRCDDHELGTAQNILRLAQQDVDALAHPLEFLAAAFGNENLRMALEKLRKHRLSAAQQHRQKQRAAELFCDSTLSRKLPEVDPEVGEPKSFRESNEAPSVAQQSQQEDGMGGVKRASSRNRMKKRLTKFFLRSKKTTKTTLQALPETAKRHSVATERPTGKSTHEAIGTPLLRVESAPKFQRNSDNFLAESSLQDSVFPNCLAFLEELKSICEDIEKSLLQSFSQKFARWALQPWTPSKETALGQVTHAMRERLKVCNRDKTIMPMFNPVHSTENLLLIDCGSCFILPSAHFPLLLSFECERRTFDDKSKRGNAKSQYLPSTGADVLYRTVVELVKLRGSQPEDKSLVSRHFSVHGSVAGSVLQSEHSVALDRYSNDHVWDLGSTLVFETRSSWGPPKTLSLLLTEEHVETKAREDDLSNSQEANGAASVRKECSFGWVDLEATLGHVTLSTPATRSTVVEVVPSTACESFDEHGNVNETTKFAFEKIEVELRVTTKVVETHSMTKRLLYKHDDDVRQEMFAIEFIKSCDRILRSCGLDMKILTFASIPVGERNGFIEWVDGSIPLSEICQTIDGSILGKRRLGGDRSSLPEDDGEDSDENTLSSVAKAGMSKYESLQWTRQNGMLTQARPEKGVSNNPVQDYLRSHAYDASGPYKIKKDVMDTYVKSCAGYSVLTYLLGVGDRHLDNLLLHHSGHFFHCDYSFIFGRDPKKYLPMRITKDMIDGMGGSTSDNFCQFLALACATFLALRRPENVRQMLSLVRIMEGSGLPHLKTTDDLEHAMSGILDRLRLDLDQEQATVYMENLIESSCSSKMWMAVDAIHSLARRF